MSREFRNALGRFATGVVVVTVEHEGQIRGMTVNSFTSVSLDPPLVLVSIDNKSSMHQILPKIGRYGISVLAEDQESFSRHYAGRPIPDLPYHFVRRLDMPLIEGATAHFVTKIVDAHPAGDHTLYVGLVEFFESREGRPLLFHAGSYDKLHPRETRAAIEDDSLFSIGTFDAKK